MTSLHENPFGYTLLGLLSEGALSDEIKREVVEPLVEELRARVEPLLGFSLDDEQVLQQLLPIIMPMLLAQNAASQNLN